MDFVRLDPEQRAAFERDGFLVVPGALDAATLERLRAEADEVAAPFLQKPELRGKIEHNHLDWRPGLVQREAMRALVACSTTVPLVAQLLGLNVHLHSTALLYKRPVDPAVGPFRRGWHRDTRAPKDLGYDCLPRVGIKICYCLTDFLTPSSGITLLLPGSHKRTEPLVIRKGEIDPEGLPVRELKLRAGDAFLFENRLFHTAVPNLSDRTSKVLIYGYAYRFMKQEVHLDGLDLRPMGPLDPVLFQLLGGYRDVDTLPWALQAWARRHGVLPAPHVWQVEG